LEPSDDQSYMQRACWHPLSGAAFGTAFVTGFHRFL
jgi:hypothetical protein